MDLQSLSNLFATTFSADPNQRKSAELQIRKIGKEDGVIAALLQIIASDSVDGATRQACAVWVKNRVRNCYHLEEPRGTEHTPVAASDKAALRSSILHLIAKSPSRLISVQLSNTLKNIVSTDFPAEWPELVEQVKALLTSSELHDVHAGCLASLEIVRAFAYSIRARNDAMAKAIEALFPTLVTIATNMVQQATPPTTDSQEIPTLLHLILKTYKTSIQINLSKHQQTPASLVPWGRLLFAVINLQIPANILPQDEEEREKNEWWVAKKWAYGTLGRLFNRYGNPSQLPSSSQHEYGDFANHFVQEFAPEILAIYLRQVELFVGGQQWISQKCQTRIFNYFTECIKPKSTWVQLKPHFESLVQNFVFPQLSFTPSKQHRWDNDPVDYIRISVDEYEQFQSPVSAATAFLFSLAGNRTKTAFMPILTFINNVLQSNPPSPQRFGALNMTAALAPWIMRHPEVKQSMEAFVMRYVFPCFSASEGEGYLRAIACEAVGTLVKQKMSWSNPENLQQNFHAVAAALDDREFPVKVQAALALTEFVTRHEEVRGAVAGRVGKVIQDLLKMSEETDLDILNHSMDVMVQRFQTELTPVAVQLSQRLCESFLRLAKECAAREVTGSDGDGGGEGLESISVDEEDDKTYAALGLAKTIGTVIEAVDASPEILAQVQEVIIPAIKFVLENKLLDLFDNTYELVDALTYKLQAVAPNMWPVFEQTYQLFKSEAIDFLDEMLPALDNFVSFGGDVFKTRQDYRQMVLDIYTTSISSQQLGENDRVNGCKVAESIMLNLRGSADDCIQTIVATALDLLGNEQTSSLKLANLEVLVNAVLYNPTAALHLMETTRPGKARTFFDRWFESINNGEAKLPRVHDKKLSIIALSALLEMNPDSVPESLKVGWAGLVGGVVKVFKDLPKAVELRKKLAEIDTEEEELEDDYDEHVLNMNDEEEDVWDEDSAYLELLANEGARQRERLERQESGEDVDEEDTDDDEEFDEDLGFISPLDNVDPYVTFKSALNAFQAHSPQLAQASTAALPPADQALLVEILQKAETNASGSKTPVPA